MNLSLMQQAHPRQMRPAEDEPANVLSMEPHSSVEERGSKHFREKNK
jgi:hypothetical protein